MTDPLRFVASLFGCNGTRSIKFRGGSSHRHARILVYAEIVGNRAVAETLTATKLRRAQNAAGFQRVGGFESCANLSKTLLLAGVSCARKNRSSRCDPLSCNI